MKNQPLLPEGAEAIEAQRKHAEASSSSEMLAMGTTSKLKMNEPKLRKAWEGITMPGFYVIP